MPSHKVVNCELFLLSINPQFSQRELLKEVAIQPKMAQGMVFTLLYSIILKLQKNIVLIVKVFLLNIEYQILPGNLLMKLSVSILFA